MGSLSWGALYSTNRKLSVASGHGSLIKKGFETAGIMNRVFDIKLALQQSLELQCLS